MWFIGLLCAAGLVALAAVVLAEALSGVAHVRSGLDVTMPIMTVISMTVLAAVASYTLVSW